MMVDHGIIVETWIARWKKVGKRKLKATEATRRTKTFDKRTERMILVTIESKVGGGERT